MEYAIPTCLIACGLLAQAVAKGAIKGTRFLLSAIVYLAAAACYVAAVPHVAKLVLTVVVKH